MTCDEFGDLLADVLERSVDESTRARVEAHALACGECGPLLADLRKLRIDAANLPELTPSRDLWSGIAERIETPVVSIGSSGTAAEASPRRSRRLAPVWLGVAAAGLVAVTATITHEITKRSVGATTVAQRPAPAIADTHTTVAMHPAAVNPSAPTPNGATSATSQPVRGDAPPTRPSSAASATTSLASNKSGKVSAEQTYDQEIARLRAIVNKRRPQLDSATVAVIEHNLKVIDDAIAQCREALRKDPNSRFLIESLNDAFDTKVQLLRTAASLPSRA
jgi:hypothetical protein